MTEELRQGIEKLEAAVTRAELAALVVRIIGCPKCQRFNLGAQNIGHEHAMWLYRFSCPHCLNAFDLPIYSAADGQ
jgi:transposase-like protein